MKANAKIEVFERSILLPALTEVATSPALLRDFEAQMDRPMSDPWSEDLLDEIAKSFVGQAGPALVLTHRKAPRNASPYAGRLAMTVHYNIEGDDVFAAPRVMYWMAFNNKLHGFAHRYDRTIACHRVEAITREHVLNHMLDVLTFFQLFAYSREPFPVLTV